MSGHERPGEHHPTRNRLPAYATAIAMGLDPATVAPDDAAHLSSCTVCRGELDELLALLLPTYAGVIAPTLAGVTPDLSFLPPAAPDRAWWRDAAGRLVFAFSEALLVASGPPGLTGAARGALLHAYSPGAVEPGGPRVIIEIRAMERDGSLAHLRVEIDDPARDPLDQAGVPVAVQAGDHAWQGESDETGQVDFPDIPLADLAHLQIAIGQ
jgi:hypothetical protein